VSCFYFCVMSIYGSVSFVVATPIVSFLRFVFFIIASTGDVVVDTCWSRWSVDFARYLMGIIVALILLDLFCCNVVQVDV